MKKILLLIILSAVCLTGRARNVFGIFIDAHSFEACRTEVEAYRDVLREEGLDARILAADWQTPEQVRDEIRRLAADRKNLLEGVVFIGNIPIAMVREAQWLTTAFKMNEQRFPIFESSVASDRFYDDFDLDFELISRDSEHPGVSYYRLTEKGSVTIDSDIYSGRIKVPQCMVDAGMDPDELLRGYLRKAVRAHREADPLDHFTFFFGSGYNSEDMNIWLQRPLQYREYFPEAFHKASGNRFLNFHQEKEMKWNLFTELQREETDFFQFTEHGAPETQYISPTGEGRTFQENLSLLKRVTARQYRRWKGTAEEEAFLHAALDSVFHLPRSIVSDSLLAVYRVQDSIANRNANIDQSDLFTVRSNPRVIMLNACFNGSFHNPEGYVAGVHIFGPGRCVAVQGNTVNVLQDKWEDRLLGYLAQGVRIGLWQREFPLLESHIIGDPTFRFRPADKAARKHAAVLTDDLLRRRNKAAVWQKYLRSDDPNDRAAGILHLKDSRQALRLLREDPSRIVRISAFEVLRDAADERAEEAIVTACRDPFELVARQACRFASARGDAGQDSCIVRAVQQLYDHQPDLARINWDADDALTMIRGHEHLDQELAKAADTAAKPMQRIYAMRTFRNYRYLKAIPVLLANAADTTLDASARQVALETLGWYNSAPVRDKIVATLKQMIRDDAAMPANVRRENLKTQKRLGK